MDNIVENQHEIIDKSDHIQADLSVIHNELIEIHNKIDGLLQKMDKSQEAEIELGLLQKAFNIIKQLVCKG